jgi:hypothetical protein
MPGDAWESAYGGPEAAAQAAVADWLQQVHGGVRQAQPTTAPGGLGPAVVAQSPGDVEARSLTVQVVDLVQYRPGISSG